MILPFWNWRKGIRFLFCHSLQEFSPSRISISPDKIVLMAEEIDKMLKKCANFFQQNRIYFFSSIFLVPKKESGYHPMIKLKNLNHCIPFTHFKMEVLLKEMLQERDCMFKTDLKDAHFSVPLYQKSQKFESFNWKDLFYQILCSCFGLGPAGSKDLHKVSIFHIEKATPTIDHISGRYTD